MKKYYYHYFGKNTADGVVFRNSRKINTGVICYDRHTSEFLFLPI